MKKLFYLVTILLGLNASAQVGIGVPTTNINPSAELEVASTTKGFLAPRMTETQKNIKSFFNSFRSWQNSIFFLKIQKKRI